MNRSLVFDLATANWVGKREDALFLGPPGSGKSHCAQAIGHAVIQQGYRVLYREAHRLLEEQLPKVSVDYDDVVATLEKEGVEKFSDSFAELLDGVRAKRETVAA